MKTIKGKQYELVPHPTGIGCDGCPFNNDAEGCLEAGYDCLRCEVDEENSLVPVIWAEVKDENA